MPVKIGRSAAIGENLKSAATRAAIGLNAR